jgi:ATP-dependent Clp protease ATP-binding subunit ClpC
MLLQIMEEGHLSDARGRKVDFRNEIIVMTSNVGADVIKRQTGLGFSIQRDEMEEAQSSYDEMRKKLLDSLRRVFRPEFINRLDAVIVFRALAKEHIQQIVSLELQKVAVRLQEHEVVLHASPKALSQLADEGFDAEMGARPLRRVIQQKVEDPLSDALLAGEFETGNVILVDVNEQGEVILRPEEKSDESEAQALNTTA